MDWRTFFWREILLYKLNAKLKDPKITGGKIEV
jgi:hypothetical protein